MTIAWIAFTLMVVVAAVGITIPLVRRYDARRATPGGSDLLARQLEDLEGQVVSLPAAEAETLRTETVRRLLAEPPPDTTPARPIGGRGIIVLALGLAAIVAIGATLLYVAIGRPDLALAGGGAAAQASAASVDDAVGPGHVAGMIAQLEAKMRAQPNDPEGWRMLGWSYMQTGRYTDAATAYGRAATLDPSNADYPSARGEALVKAADGHVTPEAAASFALALKGDPTDPRARYFLAAAKDQAGDRKGAMADWIALLSSAPPGAPWAAEVRGFVIQIAAARGEDVTSRLPPPPPPAPAADQAVAGGAPPVSGAAPGPTPEQIAAAQRMPAGDQETMVRAMVDRLATRLKADPNDPEGWVNLMRARMVLHDPTAARGAYRDARKAFAAAPDQLAMLGQAARQLGVPGA